MVLHDSKDLFEKLVTDDHIQQVTSCYAQSLPCATAVSIAVMQHFRKFQSQRQKKHDKINSCCNNILIVLRNFIWQSGKDIEISFLGRYDQYADYVSNFAGRVYNDTNKLYGLSYGVTAGFKQKIAKSVSLYFGLGFYQLRIDKIRGAMPHNIPGTGTNRNIDCTDGFDVLYSTSKYHYNNVAIIVGLEKAFQLSKGVDFTIAPK